MSPRTVERVDDWETVPFGGGYGGLRDLASQEFSGVVTAGPSRLFMIRGTVVGILDGSIDDFEGADGTARKAPHPALPLLAVMEERSDEVRAQYYTEETSIADVNRTLEDGGFTGYVELSENVLSGDYYQVYHQGRSMSVAYVGSSERLITDDDAFEQANGEVGIYEVWQVDVDAIDVPEPADDGDEDVDETQSGPTATTSEAEEESDDAGTGTDDETTDDVTSSSASSSSASSSSASSSSASSSNAASSDASAGAAESTTATDTADPGDTDSPASTATETTDSVGADEPDSTGQGSNTATTDPDTAESEVSSTASDTSSDRERSSDGANTESSASRDESSPDRHESSGTEDSGRPESDPASQSGRQREQSGQADSTSADAQNSSATAQGNANTADSVERGQATEVERRDQPPSDTGQETPSSQTGTPQGDDQRRRESTSTGTASDLEMRSIPSLDPSRTEAASKTEKRRQHSSQRQGASSTPQQSTPTQPSSEQADRGATSEPERAGQQGASRSSERHSGKQSSQEPSQQPSQGPSQHRSSEEQATEQGGNQSATATTDQRPDEQQAARTGGSSNAAVAELQTELEEREQELSDLQTDLERVEAERDDLASARDDLEAERDRLQSELEDSRAEVQRLEERIEDFAADGALDAETQLSATEAIDNTNLFVRYRSKGDATLETAHAGNADRAAVAENLRLEYHTQFDADNAAVGNESFDDFLTDTISYRFVEWLIENLLYEIRDTGHADGMADLYNGLPDIDRAELNGQVSVTYTENGEEHRSQERFDIAVRDRMGNPLVVANINDSRDPATDSMMTDLVKRAERVGESSETLAGAFLVTASFFEPEALETANEATSSGLFSRDKRKSFVNLSRKGGYHLCLVEARNQEFHLAVPEL